MIHFLAVEPGERVLDVGAGTGNTALAAARRGAVVTAIDLVEDFLETARERAAAEHLEITTQVADAQDLPFPDGGFDVAVSTFAVMFAPDPPTAAAELIRVCRPGGRIGVISWTPDGFVGHCMAALARYQPNPLVAQALRWGEEDFVRDLFGERVVESRFATHTIEMRYESPDDGVRVLRMALGPVRATFDALTPALQEALATELKEVMAKFNIATDGTVLDPAEYLEVVAVTR